jgi:hypothetical protein
MLLEVHIAFVEGPTNGPFGVVKRFVVAIMDDSAGHTAEYGLDHI